MNNFKIRTIDFKSNNAHLLLIDSLKNTGFAVIRNHGINKTLINDVYEEWKDFFANNKKFNYLFDLEKQDGYFPIKSENAHGYNVKDLKEFYHIYLPWGRVPKEITNRTVELQNQLVEIGTVLLNWIDDNSPQNVRDFFSIPLKDMIKDSETNLLRIIHYPPIEKNEKSDALRAAAHGDINLITILLSGSQPGLQVLCKNKKWVDVPSDKGWLIVNSGDMLNKCSNNYYPSTIHRVINPKNANNNVSRYSMPLFLHPRDEVVLNDKYTAKSYLEKRLKSLGLK